MAKRSSKADRKVEKVMHEWKAGTLHQGKSKKIVRSRRQALAIALHSSGSRKSSRGKR